MSENQEFGWSQVNDEHPEDNHNDNPTDELAFQAYDEATHNDQDTDTPDEPTEEDHTDGVDTDNAPANEDIDDVEEIERLDVSEKIETAVDAALAVRRKHLLETANNDKVRKAVPILPTDRRKIRRRSVDTDVSVSDLAFDAVLALLADGAEVDVASARAAKNRKDRITLTAPNWWWSLVGLTADAHEGNQGDVIATAITKHLG